MKKILAFVLAIVMVLGMATVAFAAGAVDTDTETSKAAVGTIVIKNYGSIAFTATETANAYKAGAINSQVMNVKVTTTDLVYYTVLTADGKQVTNTADPTTDEYDVKVTPANIVVTVIDDYNRTYASAPNGDGTYTITANAAIAKDYAATKYFVTVTASLYYYNDAANSDGTAGTRVTAVKIGDVAADTGTGTPANEAVRLYAANATSTYAAPVVTAVDAEVVENLYSAYNSHNDTVTINLNDASIGNKTITVPDFNWLLNTYKGMPTDIASTFVVTDYNSGKPLYATSFNKTTGLFEGAVEVTAAKSLKDMGIGDWWATANWQYLAMNFKFMDGTTLYYIDAADIDYTWNTAVDFRMDDGLSGYIKTGTTTYTSAEMYNFIRALTGDTKNPYTFGWTVAKAGVEVAVPEMTVSYVIPQQWINVYGHKNLSLWVYGNSEKCEVCGAEHQTGHQITTTTVDATTQTQRIEFTTNYFYRTLVLSQTATEAASEPIDDNPNTGANDIVNVAIVFAVISLVAAGAFVFSKQR